MLSRSFVVTSSAGFALAALRGGDWLREVEWVSVADTMVGRAVADTEHFPACCNMLVQGFGETV